MNKIIEIKSHEVDTITYEGEVILDLNILTDEILDDTIESLSLELYFNETDYSYTGTATLYYIPKDTSYDGESKEYRLSKEEAQLINEYLLRNKMKFKML